MPAISIQDLENAKVDVDHIATVATSLDDTATDRLGHVKQTLAGAVGSIAAITDRGVWTAGTAYLVKDLVTAAGIVYVCVLGHTAGATFAGDAAKWRVYQGLTVAEFDAFVAALADETDPLEGAALVGVSSLSDTPSSAKVLSGTSRDILESFAKRMNGKLGEHICAWDFVKSDGTDDTAAIQSLINTYKCINWGDSTRVYRHTGLALTTSGGLSWIGSGATITQVSTVTDSVLIRSANNTDADGFYCKGVKFTGGWAALKLIGQGAGVFKNILIEKCRFYDTGSGALWTEQCDTVEIKSSRFERCLDNGVYAAFSRNVWIHHNYGLDNEGSGHFTAGYSNLVVSAENVHIHDNICAITSTFSGNCVAGLTLVHCKKSSIHDNIVDCTNATVNAIKNGFIVDENIVEDIDVYNNQIYKTSEKGGYIGQNSAYRIRRISAYDNTIVDTTEGLRIGHATDCLIESNIIRRTGQHGVALDSGAVCTKIIRNTLSDCGIQSIWSSYRSVFDSGIGTEVLDNRYYDSQFGGKVTSSATTPAISVDASGVIRLYENSVLVKTITPTYGTTTWGDIKTAIESQAGWAFAIYAGSTEVIFAIRRTGGRDTETVNTVLLSAHAETNGFILSSPEPYGHLYTGSYGCRHLNNTFDSWQYDTGAAYEGNSVPFEYGTGTIYDLNKNGGGREWRADAPPSTTGRRYYAGDRILKREPSVGSPKAWCAVGQGVDAAADWVSEGNL